MNNTSMALVFALAALAALPGCDKREDGLGPAQQAGKAVDDAGEKVARKVQEQVGKADEAAQRVARSADEARDKIRDATVDASRGLDKVTEEAGKKVEQAGEKIQHAAK